jgi:hypothetical protein
MFHKKKEDNPNYGVFKLFHDEIEDNTKINEFKANITKIYLDFKPNAEDFEI